MNPKRLKAGHVRDKLYDYATSLEEGPGRDNLLAAAGGLALEAGRKGVRIAQERPAGKWGPGYEAINARYDTAALEAVPEGPDPSSLEYWQDMLPSSAVLMPQNPVAEV